MSEASMNPASSADGSEQAGRQPAAVPAQGLGAALIAAREARGWSAEQVASQLNLAPRQILALEAENFAALPGMASVRGFVRAYAKLVRLDAAPLVAMLPTDAVSPIESIPERKPIAQPFSAARRMPTLGDRTPASRLPLMGLAAVLLAACGFAAWQYGLISMPAAQPAPEAAAAAPAAAVAAGEQERAAEGAGAPADAAAQPAADQAAQPATPVVADSAAAVPPGAAPAAEVAPPPAPRNPLVLTLREESWIEVRRSAEAPAGGSSILVARLAKAGTTETIDITEPMVVIIGNVNGVDAQFRNAPLDLKSGAKNNVARLTLK